MKLYENQKRQHHQKYYRNGIFRRTTCLLVFWLTVHTPVSMAQDALANNTDYTQEISDLLKKAAHTLERQPEQAVVYTQNALKLAQQNSYLAGKAESFSMLGKIYKKLEKNTEALKYYLAAIRTFETMNDQAKLAQQYKETGYLYLSMTAYRKAKEYFQLYQKASEKSGMEVKKQPDFTEDMAIVYWELQEYTEAKKCYIALTSEYAKRADTLRLEKCYHWLANISLTLNQLEEAITYHQYLLSIYQAQGDIINITSMYNNLGVLYKKSGDTKMALEYFNTAISFSQKYKGEFSEKTQVALLTNIGIAYTNMSLFSRAKEYYLRAMKLQEKQRNPEGEADLYNHLASNYFISGKNALALNSATTAVNIGITYEAKETLATSYKILSLIYEEDNNLGRAQLYEDKYNQLRNKLQDKELIAFEAILQRQIDIEKKEDEIKTLLLEQEQNALEEERKENELALREKELTILKRDQELQAVALQNQQLEREKAEQALTLARQQLQAEKSDQELRGLEKQKQLQDLKLRQQTLEKERQEKAIALLEADKKLKEQKLREEVSIRKYGYGIFGLFLFIFGVVAFSYSQKQRDNRKLQKQQQEIQEKNEQLVLSEKDLRQNMEELEATQEILAAQKEQLELEYRKTQQSIEYAKRIQFSILPSEVQRKSIIPESFILYKPKDIVSGDFYWISKNREKIILSAIDCTGHGVPGALVSLIANNILNEAINEHRLTDPAKILGYLDKRVRMKLNQEEGDIKDGMDIGLCVLEPADGVVKLAYGGAKNNLFVVTQGEMLTLKGDRKSVGGTAQLFEFTTQEITLQKGDMIYMTTDGFIDQANAKRERFGSKRLKSLIEEAYPLPVEEQQKLFEKALTDHQQDTEQRDDINLIGVRV